MLNRSYITGHAGHPHYIAGQDIDLLKKTFKDVGKNQDTIQILKTLSDSTKLSIYLLLLKVAEIPVTDIGLILSLSQSTVSHALSDLKKLDLVECSRCGQLICYSLKKQSQKRTSLLSIFENFYLKKI